MKIIAISNQKGGVGKTTTAVNLSAALAIKGKRILLIDLDPQGNSSSGSGIEKGELTVGINEVLMGTAPIDQAITKSSQANVDLLPTDSNLTQAELSLITMDKRESQLALALKQIPQGVYDVVLIDTPPTLNLLSLNAMVAADSVLIPVQCEYYSLEGLSSLVEAIESVKGTFNPNLKIDAILRTMYDRRSRLSRDVSNQLFKHFSTKVLRTQIPRNIRLAEAPSYGLSAIDYDINASGSLAYMALASELMNKKVV